MSRRLWRPWRTLAAAARASIHEAGEHVAAAVTGAQRASLRVAAGALALGILAGAALVWLGVSLARQPT